MPPSPPGLIARTRARLRRRAVALGAGRAAWLAPAPTPRWVAAFDLLGVAFLLLATRVFVAGGIRFVVADLRVSVASGWRPLAWGVALLAVRHLLHLRPALHRRVASGLGAAWRTPAVRAAVGPFLVSRLAVLAVGFVAVVTFGFERPPAWRISDNELLNLPARWDSGWYLSILHDGYSWDADPAEPSSIAFFPAFPLATRLVALATMLSVPASAFLVVSGAFFWALTYLYRLARLDLSPDAARATLMLAAFYPFAVYYGALYTESLFLLVACGAFYHFRRRQLVRAGLFGLVAGLVRPNGVLLAVPLSLMALIDCLRSRGWLGRGAIGGAPVPVARLSAQALAALMPIAGLLIYSGYIYHLTGDPFAWAKEQEAWGRGPGQFARFIADRQAVIARDGLYGYVRDYAVENMNTLAALFALGAAWPVTRRFGLPYGLFIVLCILPPLLSAGSESLGRYTAPLFPIFLWLGGAVAPWRRAYWIAAFAAGEALVAALFFTWRAPF